MCVRVCVFCAQVGWAAPAPRLATSSTGRSGAGTGRSGVGNGWRDLLSWGLGVVGPGPSTRCQRS